MKTVTRFKKDVFINYFLTLFPRQKVGICLQNFASNKKFDVKLDST